MGFSIYTKLFISFRTVSSPQKETLYPLIVILYSLQCHLTPTPRQTLFYFLYLYICLFGTFHVNGMIQYVFFCGWFSSIGIMFSGFINVVTCIGTTFIFMAK